MSDNMFTFPSCSAQQKHIIGTSARFRLTETLVYIKGSQKYLFSAVVYKMIMEDMTMEQSEKPLLFSAASFQTFTTGTNMATIEMC